MVEGIQNLFDLTDRCFASTASAEAGYLVHLAAGHAKRGVVASGGSRPAALGAR